MAPVAPMAAGERPASAFDDIGLEWEGVAYAIPADRVMMAIGRIEDIVTLGELSEMLARPTSIKLTRIAKAYGMALRFAGAEIRDDDVYVGMFSKDSARTLAVNAVMGLLAMMVPPSAKKAAEEKPSPGKGKPAATPSSPRRSRSHAPRSAPADGE